MADRAAVERSPPFFVFWQHPVHRLVDVRSNGENDVVTVKYDELSEAFDFVRPKLSYGGPP
jgi:hypothetical protein